MNELIKSFIAEHQLPEFEGLSNLGGNMAVGEPSVFTISYYDAYFLLALTDKNVEHLNEDILKALKLHKNKLYFKISYKNNIFRLEAVIYAANISKCLRVISGIKKVLIKYNISTVVTSIHLYSKTYAKIQLIDDSEWTPLKSE